MSAGMVSGIVASVATKNWQDKTFYSLKLNDGEYYGFGEFRPPAAPGDKAEFYAKKDQKGFWKADKASLKISKGTEEERSNASARSVTGQSMNKDDYWARKEHRDLENDRMRNIGAARNTAIEWISTLLKAEAIKLPAAQAKKEEALNHLLNSYVELFTQGEDVAKAATKTAKPTVEEDPTGAAEEADDDWVRVAIP